MKKINQRLIFISFVLIIAINQFLAIELDNKTSESLRFLDNDRDNLEVNLICEFPFTCGNGYITSKRICNDIANELRKRKINLDEKLQPKNMSSNKRDYSRDEFFNIFVTKNNKNILIATTNNESEYFNKNLVNYPSKFISGFGVPNDKDFSQKFDLIESIENGIINSK